MAKKVKKTNSPIPGGRESKPWYPARPMGLARALHKAGYGTRKQTERFIAEGRVRVEGQKVTDPGHRVEVDQTILLDGEPLEVMTPVYFAFHKPARVVCRAVDGPGRALVTDYFPPVPGLQTAGRLDLRSTGLMLVSNDAAWNDLAAGGIGTEQEFRIQVQGVLTELEIGVMTAGIHMTTLGFFKPLGVRIVEILNGMTVVNMVVGEGKVRQVRRMLSTLRHEVVYFRRIRVGEIRLGDLPVGGVRPLTEEEVKSIRRQGKQRPTTERGRGRSK